MWAITHRNELNVILEKRHSDRENKATKTILSEVGNFFLTQTSQIKRTTFCNNMQQLKNLFCHSKQQKLPQPEHSFGSTSSVQPQNIPSLIQPVVEEVQPSVLHPPVSANKSVSKKLVIEQMWHSQNKLWRRFRQNKLPILFTDWQLLLRLSTKILIGIYIPLFLLTNLNSYLLL